MRLGVLALTAVSTFKDKRTLHEFVRELYRAGAAEVIVPDIYHSEAGAEFTDGLLVRLTKSQERRTSIRAVCATLRKPGHVLPDVALLLLAQTATQCQQFLEQFLDVSAVSAVALDQLLEPLREIGAGLAWAIQPCRD